LVSFRYIRFYALSEAVARYQPWPLIAFVGSSAYFTVLGSAAIGKKTIAVLKRKRAEQRSREKRIGALLRLSADETDLLRMFVGNNFRTIPAPRLAVHMVSTARELVKRGVLGSDGNWIMDRDKAFTIEEWAWKYFKENPDLLG
jgi:hypothetical protein